MKGYSGLYVQKTGDTMLGNLNIKAPSGDNYPALRIQSNDENKGSIIEWNGNAHRRRISVYNYPSGDSQYGEAYHFPINTLDSSVTDNQNYDILTTKELYKTFPVGSCYTTSTNIDPVTILGGGTWELIDKQFTPLITYNSSLFTVNSKNCSLTNIYVSRANHSIRIRLQILPKVTFGDTTVEIGTFNLALLGITNFWNTYYPIGNSDGGGGLTITSVAYDTGTMSHQDTIHRKGNETAITSTSYNIIYDFVVVMPTSHMLDSACNQFIWKRTA